MAKRSCPNMLHGTSMLCNETLRSGALQHADSGTRYSALHTSRETLELATLDTPVKGG